MHPIDDLLTDTTPLCEDKAIEAIFAMYAYCKCPKPNVVFLDGPQVDPDVFDIYRPDDGQKLDFSEFNEIARFTSQRGVSKGDYLRSALFRIQPNAFIPNKWDYRDTYEWSKLATDVWDSTYLVIPFRSICYVINRPKVASSSDRGFHSKTGPALAFNNGSEFYFHEGIALSEDQFYYPSRQIPLEKIHASGGHKHIYVDKIGVDCYKDMLKNYKVPDPRGRFKKLGLFSKMEKEYGKYHVEKPYSETICHWNINNEYVTAMQSESSKELKIFKRDERIENQVVFDQILDKKDLDLWNALRIEDWLDFFPGGGLQISYQDGKYSLKGVSHDGSIRVFTIPVVPIWFQAKMLRNEPAAYWEPEYSVSFEDERLELSDKDGNVVSVQRNGYNAFPTDELQFTTGVFSGNQNVPEIVRHLDISSDSWEGLLGKWAELSFDWLATRKTQRCLYG